MDIKRVTLIIATIITFVSTAHANETEDNSTDIQYRHHYGVNIEVEITPWLSYINETQFRLNVDNNRLLLNNALSLSPLKFLTFVANHRTILERIGSDDGDPQLYHFFATDAIVQHRFKCGLGMGARVRYNDFLTESLRGTGAIRYQLRADYKIRNFRVTPFYSFEWFNGLDDHSLRKVRYSAGFDYKTSENTSIYFDYRRDDECDGSVILHAYTVNYRVKF